VDALIALCDKLAPQPDNQEEIWNRIASAAVHTRGA
jgi:hypothetical protein